MERVEDFFRGIMVGMGIALGWFLIDLILYGVGYGSMFARIAG